MWLLYSTLTLCKIWLDAKLKTDLLSSTTFKIKKICDRHNMKFCWYCWVVVVVLGFWELRVWFCHKLTFVVKRQVAINLHLQFITKVCAGYTVMYFKCKRPHPAWPDCWFSIEFLHAPIPRKGSGSTTITTMINE